MPCAKCVDVPVIVTATLWPCAAEGGTIWLIAAGPVVILKALAGVVIDSAPVVTFSTRAPTVAVGSILMVAVSSVGELTATEATLIPGPRLTVVTPWTKCVFAP